MRRIAADRASFGVFLAFLLIPLSGIGTDIYLPSMPSMTSALGASAAQIQLTLTLFIAGVAWGSWWSACCWTVMAAGGRCWWRWRCLQRPVR